MSTKLYCLTHKRENCAHAFISMFILLKLNMFGFSKARVIISITQDVDQWGGSALIVVVDRKEIRVVVMICQGLNTWAVKKLPNKTVQDK